MAHPGDFLDEKSKASKLAADFLLKNQHYNSAIHCYYYSCLQRMNAILLSESTTGKLVVNKGASTHRFVLKKLRESV